MKQPPRPWIELDILIKKDEWPSRAAFAEAMNIGQGHLSDLLSGRRNPTAEFIGKAARALRVAKSQLEKRADDDDIRRLAS